MRDFELLPSEIDRFWLLANRGTAKQCWEWKGYRIRGYGRFHLSRLRDDADQNRKVIASRVALQIHLGRPLLDSECALHRCDNPPCVNPNHLYVGTLKQNADDMIRRGRAAWQRFTNGRQLEQIAS